MTLKGRLVFFTAEIVENHRQTTQNVVNRRKKAMENLNGTESKDFVPVFTLRIIYYFLFSLLPDFFEIEPNNFANELHFLVPIGS